MKLKKSKKKISNELKNRLDFIISDFDIGKNIQKNDINPENYKLIEKNTQEPIKKSDLNFGSIKKEIIAPLQTFISKKFDNISFLNKNITNKNYIRDVSNFFANDTNNQINIKNTTNKNTKNISNTDKVLNKHFNMNTDKVLNKHFNMNTDKVLNKYFNMDYKTLFLPSDKIQNKILNNFSKENNLNIKNIIKNNTNNSTIPALKEGGVVKEPTVSYLHENEAVIPLKQSNDFKNFIKNINQNTLNKNIKNENNNIADMRSKATNQKFSQQNNIENKDNKQLNSQIITQNPINVTQISNQNNGNDKPNIPLVYAGSSSKDDFFLSTMSTPKWRKSLG